MTVTNPLSSPSRKGLVSFEEARQLQERAHWVKAADSGQRFIYSYRRSVEDDIRLAETVLALWSLVAALSQMSCGYILYPGHNPDTCPTLVCKAQRLIKEA